MLHEEGFKEWWARQDSNLRPRDYESPALTAELRAREAGHCDGLEVVWKVFQFSDKEDSVNGLGGSMVTLR